MVLVSLAVYAKVAHFCLLPSCVMWFGLCFLVCMCVGWLLQSIDLTFGRSWILSVTLIEYVFMLLMRQLIAALCSC
jgi:hypothetical protein